jgi:hypothetical protein
MEVELEEGRRMRRESQERLRQRRQLQMRANGNPIWVLICQGTKLPRQIGSWTPSMGTMFIRTMVLIWMGGFLWTEFGSLDG